MESYQLKQVVGRMRSDFMLHKKSVYVLGLLILLLINLPVVHAQAGSQYTIMIDGYHLNTDVSPMLQNDRLLVPFRSIMEALNASVTWYGRTGTVVAYKSNTTITLPVGQNHAYINHKLVRLDVASKIVNGRTLVPLRFVAESLNYDVSYDGVTKTVTISAKANAGKLNNREQQSRGIFGIDIGDTADIVKTVLGEPDRIDVTNLGFSWWVYNSNYARYLQVGIKADRVVTIYSNARDLTFNGLKIGSTVEDIGNKFAINDKPQFTIDNVQVELEPQPNTLVTVFDGVARIFYLDIHEDNTLTAVRLVTTEYLFKQKLFQSVRYRYSGNPEILNFTPSAELTSAMHTAYENQLLDLANSVRYRKGLSTLSWHQKTAEVAKSHSRDMLNANYFAHYSPNTGSPVQRLQQAGIRFRRAGENIAMGQSDAIEAHESLMNSLGHRKNILNKQFTHLGVGVAGDEETIYYTQDFISP